MSNQPDNPSIPDWIIERNARWAQERTERDEKLHAAGFRLIHCVSYRNPRTGERLISTSIGALETLVITNMPDDHLKYGIGSIVVGPESEVIADAQSPMEMAQATNGVVLVVLKGTRPK